MIVRSYNVSHHDVDLGEAEVGPPGNATMSNAMVRILVFYERLTGKFSARVYGRSLEADTEDGLRAAIAKEFERPETRAAALKNWRGE